MSKSAIVDRIITLMSTGKGRLTKVKKGKTASLPKRDSMGRFLPSAPTKKSKAKTSKPLKWKKTSFIEKATTALAKKLEHPNSQKYFEKLGSDIKSHLRTELEEARYRRQQGKMTDVASMVPLPSDGEWDDGKYEEEPVPAMPTKTPSKPSSRQRRAKVEKQLKTLYTSPGSTFYTPSKRPARRVPSAPRVESESDSDKRCLFPLQRFRCFDLALLSRCARYKSSHAIPLWESCTFTLLDLG